MFMLDLFFPWPTLQFGAFAALFVIFYFFWRPKRSAYRKPFASDARRPREEPEIDQKKRALRLKQRFSPSAVPSQLDAVVVGSGAGGLVAAAVLAKTGRSVLVLEQHDQAGGCCHTFLEQGYEWDVGIHYIGQMGPEHFDRFLLDQLTDGQLDWKEMDEDYDNVVLVKSEDGQPLQKDVVPIWKDRTKLLNALCERYPENENALRQFFGLMRSASGGLEFFVLLKILPVWLARLITMLRLHHLVTNFFTAFHDVKLKTLLDQLFGDNTELKNVLGYCWGDYGVEPLRVGYGMLSLLYGHYARGAYYPVGGASEIAYTMIPVIEKAGGKVLVNANVTEILLSPDKSKAVGVRVATSSGPVDIKAPIIISDAGVSNTFRKLLPKEVSSNTSIGRLLQSKRLNPGIATIQIFVGLSGSQSELNLPAKNLWISFDDSGVDSIMDKWCKMDLETAIDAKIPFLFVGFPSAKDPTFEARFPGKSVATIITVAPMEWFKKWESEPIKHRGDDYTANKMRLARRCWDLVLQLYPSLQDRMDYIDAGSPLSTAYYINAADGETYGLDHDCERFAPNAVIALRPKVPEIDNLYLTGQDILSCGFAAAIYSGVVTCQAIMRPLGESSNLLSDIKQLYRKHRKEASTPSFQSPKAASSSNGHCSANVQNGHSKAHEE